MTDKEKIRKEVERLQKELIKNDEKGFGSDIDNACILELQNVLTYIDSLQEEPVSNDLEEACDEYYDETWDEHGGKAMVVDGCHDIWFPSQATDDFFKAGAQWQKQQLIDKACEWLNNFYSEDRHCYLVAEDIKAFKQAMEEQL